jgi:hypothetical protein
MKSIALLFFLTVCSFLGFAQEGSNTIITLYGGGGLATSNNYDVGLSGGLSFQKGILYHTGLGLNVFYQGYNILSDKEAYNAKGGIGNAGMIVHNKSSYVFVCPRIHIAIGKGESFKFYMGGGVGFNMGGEETLRKWDKSRGAFEGNYDSTFATDANINKMVFRVGFGFEEHLHLGGKWWLTIVQDFGYLANPISKTGDVDYASRTFYSPAAMKPGYISLQLGLTHTKF